MLRHPEGTPKACPGLFPAVEPYSATGQLMGLLTTQNSPVSLELSFITRPFSDGTPPVHLKKRTFVLLGEKLVAS